MEFLKTFDRYWSIAAYHNPYIEGPSPSDLEADDFEPLYNRLLVVQGFASTPTYSAADKATKELVAYFRADGKGDQEPVTSAFDEYLRLMRKELGVR